MWLALLTRGGLELLTLLPLPFKKRDHRCIPPHPADITLEEDYFSEHEVELSLSLLSLYLQEGHIFYWICDFVLGPRCTTFAGSPVSTADSMNGKAKNSLRYFSFFTSVESILNQLLIKNVHVLTCIWVKLSYINPASSHH